MLNGVVRLEPRKALQQFMENKYNHVIQVAITSGTTSETSVSIDYTIEHDEYYVSGYNVPTAKEYEEINADS